MRRNVWDYGIRLKDNPEITEFKEALGINICIHNAL